MKLLTITALTAATLAVGCGKKDPSPAAPQAPAVSTAPTPAPASKTAAPTPPPPAPPSAPAPGATAVAPSVPALPAGANPLDRHRMRGKDGKPQSDQEVLQGIVEAYVVTTLPSPVPGEQMPPLTALEQLVKYGLITGIPPAPDGKKYVYNRSNGKVEVQ